MPSQKDDQWTIWNKRIRDIGIWTFGLVLAVNEFFLAPEPRPLAIAWAGAALGFPLALRADEKRRDKDS